MDLGFPNFLESLQTLFQNLWTFILEMFSNLFGGLGL